MKLTTEDGRLFDTSTDTAIEIERTNLFFHEWGEQSLPITLPATKNNQELLHFPHKIAGRLRNEKIPVNLHDGVFNRKAQLLLLSASEKEGYECSLLLNEGSFNSQIQDVDLSAIFENESLNYGSADNAINFLRTLWTGTDERFAIFMIQTLPDTDGLCVHLNRNTTAVQADGYYEFYNRAETTEKQDGKTIRIPAGCYITPFVKVNYILKRIFQKYGYTFVPGFLSGTPFKDMVVLNNTADAIVDGKIIYTDLIPNVSIKTFLNVIRKKFCMEFVVDDVKNSVTALLFNEMIDASATADLTDKVAGKIKVDFPESYKQLKLHTDCVAQVLTSSDYFYKYVKIDSEQSDYVSLKNLYPDALLDRNSGTIYRLGFKGDSAVLDGVGSMNTDYYTGGSLETEQSDCEEKSPGMMCSKAVHGLTFWESCPVIEDIRYLHTKVIMDNATTDDSSEKVETSNTDELPVMLCFTYRHAAQNMGKDYGTISNYYYDNRMWDYTLMWNGPDGLFERFWRKYDAILRNSMHTVTADVLLTEADKMQLQSTGKISIGDQELLPDTIRYKVGEKDLCSCDFVTTALYAPVSVAPVQDWPKVSKYSWQAKSSLSPSKKYKSYKVEPEVRYYLPPTEAEYTAGGQYHTLTFAVLASDMNDSSGNLVNPVDATLTVWLEPQLTSYPF